eukprot:7663309-Alexandrium_andersonii.AAC.1
MCRLPAKSLIPRRCSRCEQLRVEVLEMRVRVLHVPELEGPGVQDVEPYVARELEARERAAPAPA